MKKILIIEDEKIIRNELKSLLENSGYEVLIIEKFDNVKENIKNMKFDLILMDDMMPDLNGCETLKNLHDLENFNTPVILVTAASKDEVQNKITTYGFADYLGKPLNKELLNDTILKYLK